MRTAQSFSLVKGRRLRVTRLDACGRPVYGDDASAVSKGFISVAATANTSSSDEINVTNANGDTCVFEASVTSLVGFGLELVFCDVDPEIFALITGQDVVVDRLGNPVGFDVDTSIELSDAGFALEVWAGVATTVACDDSGAEGTFGYILFPFLQGGILGDFTVENGAISFTLTGAQTKSGGGWGRGPYDVTLNTSGGSGVPGKMLTPVPSTVALRTMLVAVAPPEAETGTRPLLDPTLTSLTSVSASVSGHVATITVIPDPAVDEGVYYTFGDGTWDYVLGGDTTHTYPAAGSYTLSASTNGVWVTHTVVIT